MTTELDIHMLMKSLADRRPIFRSENEFQLTLEELIYETFPECETELEYQPFSNENMRIDLWLPSYGTAIELKHATQKLNVPYKGRRFALKEHSAQDTRCYDFVKDIRRLERLVDECPDVNRGLAVFLTNDASYWSPPAPNWRNAQDAAFRLHGVTLSGTRGWREGSGEKTIKGREAPIVLNGSYKPDWRPYSKVGDEKYSRFQYLAVEIRNQDAK